jgi:zinc-finger of transposase IS204/IS1001/IS1096/IS1165
MASNDRDVSTGDRVLGLRGFRIVGDESTPDELILTIETTGQTPPLCPRCGTKARALGRYPVHYRDLPAFGMPVRLIWKRRRWQCPNPACSTKTWSEESDQMNRSGFGGDFNWWRIGVDGQSEDEIPGGVPSTRGEDGQRGDAAAPLVDVSDNGGGVAARHPFAGDVAQVGGARRG